MRQHRGESHLIGGRWAASVDEVPAPGRIDVTGLLREWRAGSRDARDRLFAALYEELRRMAAARLRLEAAGHILQPTALVNELYVRLVSGTSVAWQSRAHFFAVAAHCIRRILVEHARRQRARKRAGGWTRVTFDESLAHKGPPDIDILVLDCALAELATEDEQVGRVVELRFFGGLSIDELAAALSISPATVKRDLAYARAWLYDRLREESGRD